MITGPSQDSGSEDRREENDPVWRLLAQAPRPEPDAWFAARTMARCRHEGLGGGMSSTTVARIWRWALGGGLAVTMAVALMVNQIPPQETAKVDNQKSVQEAFEIMASIDTDSDSSASSTSTSWQDSSL